MTTKLTLRLDDRVIKKAKKKARAKALRVLEKLQVVFSIAAVDEKVIPLSLASGFKDFEDAVQYHSALQVRADCLITGNKQDYRADYIPVMTPEEFPPLSSFRTPPHTEKSTIRTSPFRRLCLKVTVDSSLSVEVGPPSLPVDFPSFLAGISPCPFR